MEAVGKLDHGLCWGSQAWPCGFQPRWLNAICADRMPAEFLVPLDGRTPVGAVQNLQKGDFVSGGSALSVAHPKPGVLSVVHAEGCTVALLVERTRVAAGAGRIPKQAEPYEQVRQRKPLFAERDGVLHQESSGEWKNRGSREGMGGGSANVRHGGNLWFRHTRPSSRL